MFFKVSFEPICWMFPVQTELYTHSLTGIDNFLFNYLQSLELKINLNCQPKPLKKTMNRNWPRKTWCNSSKQTKISSSSSLTSLEMMPARRARLPKTKENSLTWARPAETIHRMCRELGGKMVDSTSTAMTNWSKMREVRRWGNFLRTDWE